MLERVTFLASFPRKSPLRGSSPRWQRETSGLLEVNLLVIRPDAQRSEWTRTHTYACTHTDTHAHTGCGRPRACRRADELAPSRTERRSATFPLARFLYGWAFGFRKYTEVSSVSEFIIQEPFKARINDTLGDSLKRLSKVLSVSLQS